MQMQALRKETAAYTWDGRYCGVEGAAVMDDSGNPHPHYSVFRRQDNDPAVVAGNVAGHPVTLTVEIPGKKGDRLRFCRIGGDWDTGNTFVLGAQECVVLL